MIITTCLVALSLSFENITESPISVICALGIIRFSEYKYKIQTAVKNFCMSKVSVDLGSIYIIMSYIQNNVVIFKEQNTPILCFKCGHSIPEGKSSKTLTVFLEDKKVTLKIT